MNEIIIKPQRFDAAKNKLRVLSKEIPQNTELSTIKTQNGLFGLFSHKVTGEELNELTSQIQNHLISLNNQNMKTIDGFNEVYKALESLDKEYISAILASIKAAEKASEQAKKAASDAKRNTIDIENTIKTQEKTINILKGFKDQLNKYKNLENVDEMYNNIDFLKEEVNILNNKIEINKGILEEEIENQKNFIIEIDKNINFIENKNKIQTEQIYGDIDSLKEGIYKEFNYLKESINTLSNKIESNKNIFELEAEKQKNDIDSINKSIIEIENKNKIKIKEIYALINEEKTKNENINDEFKMKIKNTYIMIGCSSGVAILAFILGVVGR